MSNEKLDCAIVSDLLPLYHDGVVNEITAEAVKSHLNDCKNCTAEFEKLQLELPAVEKDASTKSKFSGMMKKLKRKRIFITIIVAILSCALLAGSFYVLTQVPIVDVDDAEIEVIRVYRYEADGFKKFFILYSRPKNYNGITFGTLDVTNEDGSCVLKLNEKRTILYQKPDEPIVSEGIWVLDANYWEDFDELKFGDNVIWTEAENADDEVPDYVYAYDEFENGRSDITWITAIDEGYLGAQYPDGSCKYWSLNGDVIYNGPSDMDV